MMYRRKRSLLFHALVPAVLAAFMVPAAASAAEECRVSVPAVTVEVAGSGAPREQAYELVLEKDPGWASEETPMPEKTAVTVVGGGEASFGEIVYRAPGDYKYIISQKADEGAEGLSYDSGGPYGVTVRITNDGSGGLASQVWAYREKDKNNPVESKAMDIRFTNRYTGGDGGAPGSGSGGSGGRRPSGGSPGGVPGQDGGPGAEGDGLTQIADGRTPLGGLIPEGLGGLIPEDIMDSIIPLAMLPQTGDPTSLGLWILLAALSSCGLGGLMFIRKRIA